MKEFSILWGISKPSGLSNQGLYQFDPSNPVILYWRIMLIWNNHKDVILWLIKLKSKPHLNDEEIKFIMEENFDYDEDVDEERDIKRKKLAYKEEVAKAKNFLDDLKNKYYDQVRLRPGVTEDQQKAIDF